MLRLMLPILTFYVPACYSQVKGDEFMPSVRPQQTIVRPFASDFAADDHAGLLGKRFIAAVGSHSSVPEDSESMSSVGIQLNAPAPWTDDLLSCLSHDLFVTASAIDSYGTLTLRGDNIGISPSGMSTSGASSNQYDLDGYTTAIGTTAFVSIWKGFRPFVQLGYRYSLVETSHPTLHFDSNPRAGLFPYVRLNTRFESEHELLLNPGLELDVSQKTSFRAALRINSRESFRYSGYDAGLVIWPRESWFMKLAVIGSLDGEAVGGLFGAGIRF